MNYAALWHEATQRYCYCLESGRFLFRLQTAKDDIKSVTLHTLDKYLPLKIRDTRKTTPMKWVASDGLRDYYEVALEFRVVCLRYCFELEDNAGNRVFFSNSGFTDTLPDDIERLFDCPQTLREEERFLAPDWASDKVIYQIFPPGSPATKKWRTKSGIRPPSPPMRLWGQSEGYHSAASLHRGLRSGCDLPNSHLPLQLLS